MGLTVTPATLEAKLADHYAPFADASGDAELLLNVTCEPGGDDAHSILQADFRAEREEYLLDGPQFYGMIGPSRGQALLRLQSNNPAREVEYFLRASLAFFARDRGGLLVHSAALKVGDGAYLFTGQSGSGKSTVVSLSQGRSLTTALSDDLIVMRPIAGAWHAFGTPFWNYRPGPASEARAGQTASAAVRAIYKLTQDRDVFVEPMSPAAAAAELLANCPMVNCQPTLIPDVLLRCRDIARAVGMQKLHFRKDDAFWEIISC